MANQFSVAGALRDDGAGIELRRMQRKLRDGRDDLIVRPNVENLELAAKAYDAGIALLPELWRLEQRK